MKTQRQYSLILLIAISLWILACQPNNEPNFSLSPITFTVTADLAGDSGTDVELTWNRIQKSNGDPVFYAVEYKDTVIKNLTDTAYTIRNVKYNSVITGRVIVYDNSQTLVSEPFSITSLIGPYVQIPDLNFEKALIRLGIDSVQDGQLLVASARKVTSLGLASKGISSLQGIEVFASLRFLFCEFNNLTSLDISKNVKLEALSVAQSRRLGYLDVSKNKALRFLVCNSAGLTRLDIRQNTALTSLDCSINQITDLDLSNNKELTHLICFSNKLSKLDISMTTKLLDIDCQSNQLASLDFRKNILLTYIRCDDNQLTDLDLRNNVALEYLYCQYNKIQVICLASLSLITGNWAKDNSTTYQVCM